MSVESTSAAAGWTEMVATFESVKLPVPPVPEPLRPTIQAAQRWCWSSRHIDPFDMYWWGMAEVKEVFAGTAPEYVAVSHAGHGVNSYAITYHLVYRKLALFVQVGWGGVYMDNAAQAALLAEQFRRCRNLIDACETRRAAPAGRVLLCLDSPMRGSAACGWVTTRSTSTDAVERFLAAHRVTPGKALAQAQRLLSPA